jgi:hypothetical protein
MIGRYLSILEITHRWHDVNPDKSDPENLPLNVYADHLLLAQTV